MATSTLEKPYIVMQEEGIAVLEEIFADDAPTYQFDEKAYFERQLKQLENDAAFMEVLKARRERLRAQKAAENAE